MCSGEGTQCEYVIGSCAEDIYVCTSAKWARVDTSDAAACTRFPRTGGDAAADGAADGAADAASE